MDDPGESILSKWDDNCVDVVGGDDKFIQAVALPIKITERVFDQWFGNCQ